MLIWECPKCRQETLEIDGGVAQCQSCKYNADPQELAAINSKVEPEICPECWAQRTFALVPHNNEANMWACFSCGQHGDHYHRCLECNLIQSFHDEGKEQDVCDSCWEDIKRK